MFTVGAETEKVMVQHEHCFTMWLEWVLASQQRYVLKELHAICARCMAKVGAVGIAGIVSFDWKPQHARNGRRHARIDMCIVHTQITKCALFNDFGPQRNYLAFMLQHADRKNSNAEAEPLRLTLMLNNLGRVTRLEMASSKSACSSTSPADSAATCASSACLWDSLRARST